MEDGKDSITTTPITEADILNRRSQLQNSAMFFTFFTDKIGFPIFPTNLVSNF